MTAPTSTTNITGFLIITRGSSFQKESRMAFRRILRSPSEVPCAFEVMNSSKRLSRVHQQMLENRPQAQGREERQRADDQNYRNQQHSEQRTGDGESAQRFWYMFFRSQVSGDGQNGNDHEKPPQEHGKCQRRVVPERVGVNAGESGAIVADARGVRVENLREAMRSRITDARQASLGDDGYRGEN